MAVHQKDFWSVGGFNESMRYKGEDKDLQYRLEDIGLQLRHIPKKMIYHHPHTPRYKKKRIAILFIVESCKLFVKWGNRYSNVYSKSFYRIKHRQVLSVIISVMALTVLKVIKCLKQLGVFEKMKSLIKFSWKWIERIVHAIFRADLQLDIKYPEKTERVLFRKKTLRKESSE